MLDPLYDSLSSGFKSRHQLSRTGFGQAWDDLTSSSPYLRYALYKATSDPSKLAFQRHADGDHASVVTVYRGHRIQVDLVREGYWELYVEDPQEPAADPRREADRQVDNLFRRGPGGLSADPKQDKLFAYSPLPRGGIETLSNLRAGYEWKVDGFSFEEVP